MLIVQLPIVQEIDSIFALPKRLLKERQSSYDRSLQNISDTGINTAEEAFGIWDSQFKEFDEPKMGKDKFKLCARKVLWITPNLESNLFDLKTSIQIK